MKDMLMRLGPWRVERMLGRDLSGTYYAARDDEDERATLYLPSDDLTGRSRSLTRLLEQHRDITHPALVRFYDVDHVDGEPFLLASAVDDELASLRKPRRPAPGHACAFGAVLAAALVAAHDRGLVHGGLELDNVLWAPERAPRILGVGAAGLGMADHRVLAHGDVAALGRLLCTVIAGRPPSGAGATWIAADARTVELVGLLADPSATISMREAHALLVAGEPSHAPRPGSALATAHRAPRLAGDPARRAPATSGTAQTEDYVVSPSLAALTVPVGPVGPVGAPPATTADPAPGAPAGAGLATSAGGPPPADHLGRYRILTRLGRGGMGEVLLAEDPALRRGVAIKRIRPGLEHDRTFRARLRREAQLAARLSHRAIVQVFDLITTDRVDHVVMEYVPGPSLHTLLAGSPMAVAEAVRIAAELADGLAYAHHQGVIHRDLKLENILITTDGQPKIADFGIARRIAAAGAAFDAGARESLTHDGCVVGTLRAMAPEQFQGLEVDARSDLFSFGIMLYELLTGVSPFAAGVEIEALHRVLHHHPPPVRDLVPDVPRALSELVDHLLEKEPARRPASALAVRDRLRHVLEAPPAPTIARASTPRIAEPPASPAMPRIAEPPPAAPDRRPSTGPGAAAARFAGAAAPIAAVGSGEYVRPGAARDRDGHARDRKSLSARMQAPFVLAEIRALRSSIFKRAPEVQSALAIADHVEHSYDLRRPDLFIPALDTFCAILEPFAATVLTGPLRRIGYEIFPQYVSILGIAAPDVKAAMHLDRASDLLRVICDAYSKCVVGDDAGTLRLTASGSVASVTDTTFMPCQLQMGVFLGAGKLTGLFRDTALTERRCRSRGDGACVYDFAF